jgi:hypothetical protein
MSRIIAISSVHRLTPRSLSVAALAARCWPAALLLIIIERLFWHPSAHLLGRLRGHYRHRHDVHAKPNPPGRRQAWMTAGIKKSSDSPFRSHHG